MLALQLHESKTCGCGCGLPVEVAHDPKRPFVTDTVVCQARKWLTVAQRDFTQEALPADKRDKGWVKGRPQSGDGVLWTVQPHEEQPRDPEVRA